MLSKLVGAKKFGSFNEVFKRRVRSQPNDLVFRHLDLGMGVDVSISFSDLKRRTDSLASFLSSRFEAGDKVVLFYPTGLEFIAALLGCLNAGLVAVPAVPPNRLSPKARHEWISVVVEKTNAKAVLTTRFLSKIIRGRFTDTELVQTDTIVHAGSKPKFVAQLDTLAIMYHFTERTGRMAEVTLTHRNILEEMRRLQLLSEHWRDSVMIGCLPLSFGEGLVGHVLLPIFVGSHSVFISPFEAIESPRKWLDLVAQVGASTMGAPRLVYDLCVMSNAAGVRKKLDLSKLRSCYSDGGALSGTTQSAFTQTFSHCGFQSSCFRSFDEKTSHDLSPIGTTG